MAKTSKKINNKRKDVLFNIGTDVQSVVGLEGICVFLEFVGYVFVRWQLQGCCPV